MANERQQVINIRYDGYSATPSDYDCSDGQLATALNVVMEDGSLKPVLPAGRVNRPKLYDGLTFIGNLDVIFCHKNGGWVHYIGYCQDTVNNKLYYAWLDYEAKNGWENTADDEWDGFYEYPNGFTKERNIIAFEGETHQSITAIGNMLIISTDKSTHYFLWKKGSYEESSGTSGEYEIYKYLGTEVPKVEMEFALNGELVMRTYASGLTYNGGNTTDSETWSIKLSTSLTLTNTRNAFEYIDSSGDTQTYPYVSSGFFSEEVTVALKANTEYCFFLNHDSAYYGSEGIIVFGYAEDGKWYLIYNGSINATDRHPIVTKRTYTKILVLRKRSKQAAEISFRIEEGFTGVPVKSPDYTQENYDALMGAINSFTNIYATKKEKFIHPFFVRYGVRLYTGDYIHVSPPVLMRPNTGYVPMTQFVSEDYHSSTKGDVYQYAFVAKLQARVIEELSDDWRDIIAGVDIFCSQPIFPYNQGQEFEASEQLFEYYTYYKSSSTVGSDTIIASHNDLTKRSYGYLRCQYNDEYLSDGLYTRLSLGQAIIDNCGAEDTTTANQVDFVRVSPYTTEEVMKKVKAVSSFYKIATLPFAKLSDYATGKDGEDDTFTDVDIEEGALSNLAAREALTDDPICNRTFTSAGVYAYNKRLHLYDACYRLPDPTLMHLQNGYYYFRFPQQSAFLNYGGLKDAYVVLETDDGSKVACHNLNANEIFNHDTYNNLLFPPVYHAWFFYPDNRAKEVVFVDHAGNVHELPLTTHDTLNGAYWCADTLDGLQSVMDTSSRTVPTVDDEVKTNVNVYVSEVNNPFAFKSENVVNIDCTQIIGLASAAKAMSSGQFGQFPLYCFTDNGVWSLELTSTGVYKATQPITRDVCISAESITQLDGSVLFATARGIMEVVGSASNCISDNLEADDMFVPTNLPQVEALLKHVNQGSSVVVSADTINFVSFIIFCSGCRMIYDYVQQRIIVYNPAYRYAYVYSLKSKTWGMMQSTIASSFNSYPDALAMDSDGYLIDFNATLNSAADADDTEITGVNGLVVTRPMKLGMSDIYKTIDTIIQRGYFKTSHVQSVLYASNNLFDWKAIWASNNEYLRGMSGTPYKYFRVGLICKLDKEESISGMTVRFEPRLTNRPR